MRESVEEQRSVCVDMVGLTIAVFHPSFPFWDDCSVDIYHASLPSVRIELEYEFTPSSIKAFFSKVSQLDAERIHGVFTLKTMDPSGGLLLGNLAQASRAEREKIAITTSTAMYEILSQRRLYSDFRIIRVISKVWRKETRVLWKPKGNKRNAFG